MTVPVMNTPTDIQRKLAEYPSKSAKIRYLDGQGWTRTEIAKELGIRYQHVRSVLVSTPKRTGGLTQLGRKTPLPASPDKAKLECVPNPHPGVPYIVRFACPEFTSLCPVTGQPDFAHLVIDYVPRKLLLESKSLKLFLGSFRHHAGFHEACTVTIAKRLVKALKPAWLRIGGYWYPRGGIPIDIFYQTGAPPKNLWLPDQGVSAYRGRG